MVQERVCPHCRQPIYDEDALLCHFCGESLGRVSKGALGALRYKGPRAVWVTGVLVIAAAFLLLYILF